MSFNWLNLLVVLGLTAIHIFSKYIPFHYISLKQLSSFAAGIGISYIFLHLFPTVSTAASTLQSEYNISSPLFLYFFPLISFVFFYTLDHLAYIDWGEKKKITNPKAANKRIFWTHMGFFILYNAVIGYYLVEQPAGFFNVLIVFTAFGLHFITNDWSLRHHHEKVYDKYGRVALSFSALFGFLVGSLTNFPPIVMHLAEAFILGGMLLNVFKRELPSEDEEKVPSFLIGAAISALLFSLI